MSNATDTKFDPKVSSLEVHVADMQRHLMAVGQIMRAEGAEAQRLQPVLKGRLESLVKVAQAAIALLPASYSP